MASNKQINIIIEAILKNKKFKDALGQTKKGMEKTQKSANKFFSGLKAGIAAYVGVKGVQMMIRGIQNVVKAFGVQELAQKTLAAAMKQAGTFTEEAFQHNLKYASSLQKMTTFGDEAILGVQKMLTNFGVEGEMLDKLTKSTLDLAAAKGMDLKAAADLVSKSVGSSTNALSRYGITVEGTVGSTERAQQAVDNITRLFGGAAQAEAQTFSGSIEQLKNEWGDLKEELGARVIPVIGKLTTALKDFFASTSREEKALRDLKLAQAEVLKIQAESNKLVKEGKKDTDEYEIVQNRLSNALFRRQLAESGVDMAVAKLRKEHEKSGQSIEQLTKRQKVLITQSRELREESQKQKKASDDVNLSKWDRVKAAGAQAIAESKLLSHSKELAEVSKDLNIQQNTGSVLTSTLNAKKAILNQTNLESIEIAKKEKKAITETMNKALLSAKQIETIEEGLKEFKKQVREEDTEAQIKHLEKLTENLENHGEQIIENEKERKAIINKIEEEITAQKLKEWDKRLKTAKQFTTAMTSIGEGLIAIEINRLNAIDEADTEAREKQKAKIIKIAKVNKRIAKATAIIDAASAVLKTMASLPFPANVALAVLQGIAGGIQVAKIQSEPIPSFQKGIRELESDQLAQIHKGERIIPAGMNIPGLSNAALIGNALSGMQLAGGGDVFNNTKTDNQKWITISGDVNVQNPDSADDIISQLETLAEDTGRQFMPR